jgi:hypothetical protein
MERLAKPRYPEIGVELPPGAARPPLWRASARTIVAAARL